MELSKDIEYPEVAKIVHELFAGDENAPSQKSLDFQVQLDELCEFLHKTQDFKYFGTENARKPNSDARRLVESGSSIFKNFDKGI